MSALQPLASDVEEMTENQKKLRVLVCGGRNFSNYALIEEALEAFRLHHGPLHIIQGEARGADACAKLWAVRSGASCQGFRAEWSRFGRSAGPLRNQRMLEEGKPDIVLAFPGGHGTADMVARARAWGIPVKVYS